jgi:hypothetical protein
MNDPTRALVADTCNIAREPVESVFEKRWAALSAGVVQAVGELLAGARSELITKINQSARRLRASATEEEWSQALVDATQDFSDRGALFLLRNGSLHLAAARSISVVDQMPAIPLNSAPAFGSAAQSRDTIVALRTQSEMSGPIARLVGEDMARKFCVIPIAAKDRVVALLYADADQNVETSGLELLATVAGGVMEGRVFPAGVRSAFVSIAAPAWSPEEQDRHVKAQRFARTQTAEMRLYKSENVKNGRSVRNLYTSLKEEIDSARETFRRDFLSSSGTMVDYLHLELVRTLANDDVELLGPDYPGPLV